MKQLLALVIVGAFVAGSVPAMGAAPKTPMLFDNARNVLLGAAGGDLNAMGCAYTTPNGPCTPVKLADLFQFLAKLDKPVGPVNLAAASPVIVGAGTTHANANPSWPFCDTASVFAFYFGSSSKMTLHQAPSLTGTPVCGGFLGNTATTVGSISSTGNHETCMAAQVVVPAADIPIGQGGYVCDLFGHSGTYGAAGNDAYYGYSFFGFVFDYVVGETGATTYQA
jgi:hypothetical protein